MPGAARAEALQYSRKERPDSGFPASDAEKPHVASPSRTSSTRLRMAAVEGRVLDL